jgi:hypothetical protein
MPPRLTEEDAASLKQSFLRIYAHGTPAGVYLSVFTGYSMAGSNPGPVLAIASQALSCKFLES